jgi:hypothetical protein
MIFYGKTAGKLDAQWRSYFLIVKCQNAFLFINRIVHGTVSHATQAVSEDTLQGGCAVMRRSNHGLFQRNVSYKSKWIGRSEECREKQKPEEFKLQFSGT